MYKIQPRGTGEELHFLKNLKGEQMAQKEKNISVYKSVQFSFSRAVSQCIRGTATL